MAFNTIAFDPRKCVTGCRDCERACAYLHEKSVDPTHARIQIVPDATPGSYGIAQCRQCGDPRCVLDCPARALTKNEEARRYRLGTPTVALTASCAPWPVATPALPITP